MTWNMLSLYGDVPETDDRNALEVADALDRQMGVETIYGPKPEPIRT